MSGRQQTVPVGPGPIRCGPLVKMALEVWAWVAQYGERASERRALGQLTVWQLRDIGISRAEADAEAGKWFWDR